MLLKNGIAPGTDDIKTEMLRDSSEYIAKPLMYLF